MLGKLGRPGPDTAYPLVGMQEANAFLITEDPPPWIVNHCCSNPDAVVAGLQPTTSRSYMLIQTQPT
jgi:hypothetical protein